MSARRRVLFAVVLATFALVGQSAAQEPTRESSDDAPPKSSAPIGPSADESTSPKITFFDDLAQAQAAADDDRPIVLLFGATWCGWCRKLKDETLVSPEVAALGQRLAWVEIDVDDEPHLAARYKARGLPHTAVVKRSGEELAARSGFMRAPAFVEFLNRALDPAAAAQPSASDAPSGAAEPTPAEVAAQLAEQLAQWQAISAGEATPEQVRDVVVLLARADRAQREPALALLKSWGEAATPVVVGLLEDERLAVRAAAAQTLPLLTTQRLSFDPFASRDEQHRQAAAWREALMVAPPSTGERTELEAPDAPAAERGDVGNAP